MDLLHEHCGGVIETFDPEDYGLCEECGEEGYFHVVREDENAYAVFHDTTCRRE